MAVRMMLPAIFFVVIGFSLMLTLPVSTTNPFLIGLIEWVRWLPMLCAVAAGLWSLWVGLRLWQWHRGNVLVCECEGILGWEREGRFGPYRPCLACGRNVAQRHYAVL